MQSKHILNKLMNALNGLPDKDLHQLATLFEQPKMSEALVKLIESTIALREIERKSKSEARKKATKTARVKEHTLKRNHAIIQNGQVDLFSMYDLRSKFVALLEDRNLFPSTRDVVDAVNSASNWGINYNNFRKRGRRDLIHKCLRHLTVLQRQDQQKMLRTLLNRIQEQRGDIGQYREFFKILIGNE